MGKIRSKKALMLNVILGCVVVYSIVSLNYSGMAAPALRSVTDVIAGLFQPDWSFVYNGGGEDLLSLLGVTLCIAFLGTCIAAVLSLPLSIVSAKNFYRSFAVIPKLGKFFCNVLRAFPELIYAIIFVKMAGPGPFAGLLAIGVHQIGMLGKLYTEEWEGMDEAPVEAMEAVGANFWQILFYARLPQLIPIFLSLCLNHFEIALRSAATLGLVGAGGLGAPIIFAIQSRNWGKVSIILLGIVVMVSLVDWFTGYVRKKLQ